MRSIHYIRPGRQPNQRLRAGSPPLPLLRPGSQAPLCLSLSHTRYHTSNLQRHTGQLPPITSFKPSLNRATPLRHSIRIGIASKQRIMLLFKLERGLLEDKHAEKGDLRRHGPACRPRFLGLGWQHQERHEHPYATCTSCSSTCGVHATSWSIPVSTTSSVSPAVSANACTPAVSATACTPVISANAWTTDASNARASPPISTSRVNAASAQLVGQIQIKFQKERPARASPNACHPSCHHTRIHAARHRARRRGN